MARSGELLARSHAAQLAGTARLQSRQRAAERAGPARVRAAEEAERRLRAAGIDPGARGEVLGVQEFARLAAVPLTSHPR